MSRSPWIAGSRSSRARWRARVSFLEAFQGACRGHRRRSLASPASLWAPAGLDGMRRSVNSVSGAQCTMMTDRGHGLEHGLTDYGDRDFSLYLRRSFAQSMGYSRAMLGKPVVGIAYTASGFNNCHRHFPELLAAVKRGVLAAGGLPLEFPTISLGEVFLAPTSLKYRNLMSIDTEEMIRAQPMDAVVLMGGCDKTVPAQLMGAVSAGRPAIMLVAGPMMTGRHRGERLGACTDCRRFWARYRAGDVERGRDFGGRRPARRHRRHLRRHGHRLHHGLHRRGARADASRHRGDPGRACRSPARGGGDRRGGGGPDRHAAHPRADRHRQVGGERAARAACARRLDQCDHSSHGDRGPCRGEGVAPAAQHAVRDHAGPGRSQADRQRLHGGFPSPPAAWARCCASSRRCCTSIA